jgi:uncharacterized membrane protein
MKSFFKKIINFRFTWLILLIIIALPTFWRLLGSGYFPMHDDLQVGRLYQMDLCFRDWQIPCRWVPDMGYGYGYPLFNYYPPLPYYLGEIFHLLGFSYLNSIKILFILALLFSGIFAYLLGKELWGKYGGIVTAVFYLYAPYHAVDVYVRGALNEFCALALFPAVFWATYKLIKEKKKIFIALLAFFLALLLLSHNLMAFFILPFLGIFALFLIWYLRDKVSPKTNSYFRQNKKIIYWLLLSGIWGLALAAFFTLPVIFEQRFVHLETMFMGYFNYLAHFATINQLFFSRFWGYGASVWGIEDGLSFSIGQIHWFLGATALIIFGCFYLRKKRKEIWLIFLLFVFFLITTFLAHQRSSFIWSTLPVLANMQFPWRFVGLSGFFVSFLSGSIFLLIKNKKKTLLLASLLIIIVVAANFSFFQPEKILRISDDEKLFSANGWYKLQTDAIFDYLPVYTPLPPAAPAPTQPYFVRGEGGEIRDFQKGTDWQKFQVEVFSESLLQLPLYDFPGWQVLVNGKPVEINHQNQLGLITISLKSGDYQIEAQLEETPVRKTGNYLSLLAWLGMLGFVIKYKHGRFSKSN